jgi:hypothetical protein
VSASEVHDSCNDRQHWNYAEIGQKWYGGVAKTTAIPAGCVRLGTIHRIPEGLDPAPAAIRAYLDAGDDVGVTQGLIERPTDRMAPEKHLPSK